MGKRLLPKGYRWTRRMRKYKGVPFDYILKDKYHPYVSDPGDNENPGLLLDGTVVMHPVFAEAEDLSGKPDPFGFKNMSDDQIYSMYEGLQEPETVQNLHQWRRYRDNPEPEAERLLRIQQNEPLQIVSPEFDLITLGQAGRDLWKGINTFRTLKKVPMSYTGVPRDKVSGFMKYKRGPIYTTDDMALAEQYATGDYGKGWRSGGKVFKIYDMENGKDIVNIPEPKINPSAPNERYAYHWTSIPYDLDRNGNPIVMTHPLYGTPDLADTWIPNDILEKYQLFTTPVSNRAGIYRKSGMNPVDELYKQLGKKRGIRIPSVVDGAYVIENEAGDIVLHHPAMTETVYTGTAPGLMRAPINEPEWLTAWRNTRNMGSSLTGPGINMIFSNNGQ